MTRALRRSLLAATGALLWLLMLDYPSDADVGFDGSWRLVMHWAAREGLAFGREFVFTYGALGHLLTRAYAGGGLWDFLAAQALLAAAMAWLGLIAARRLGLFRGLGLVVFMAAFVWGETLHVVLLLLLAGLVIPNGVQTIPRALAVAALCAALGLMKPTSLMLAVIVVAGVALSSLFGRPRLAALVLVSFPFAFLLGFWLAGQKPADLPTYLHSSVLVALENNESMSLEESSLVSYLGLSTVSLLLAGAALCLAAQPPTPRIAIAIAVLCGFTYVKWKHGFVRADTHVNHFFLFALAVALVSPLFVAPNAGLRRLRGGCSALLAVSAIAGGLHSTRFGADGWLRSIAWRTKQSVANLIGLPGLRDGYEARWREIKGRNALPRSAVEIAGASVDVVGPAQGLALVNDFQYRPRPVFQTWSAYSGRLNRINESFLLSRERPDFVLQELKTIDRRLPAQDDARVLALLLRDYTFVHEEAGQLLFRRDEAPAPRPELQLRLLRQGSLSFGEGLWIGDLADHDLWVQIDFRPSWLGRLRKLLYKLPRVELAVADGHGRSHEYRLLRLVASDGFILSPLFRDSDDWSAYVREARALRPARVAVVAPDGAQHSFEPEIRIRLFSIELARP